MANPDTTPERWRQLSALLDEALELAPAERAVFLSESCGSDAALRAELEALLNAAEREPGFLDRPATELAAPVIAEAVNTTVSELDSGARIGPYRILHEAGRGGMGAVYLAERDDDQFRMRVALKLIPRSLATDELVRRFREERQILATLEHPGIARLLDGGVTTDGLPWFAMEYVEGTPLDQWADEHRLNTLQRAELFIAVCDAVDHAHRHHIVHRDLKASNVLVNGDGRVKLLDFGIARLMEPDAASRPELTRTGTLLLTPEYASPEQLRGEPVSPASDVYSLGVLLYRLLAGRHPFDAASRTARAIESGMLDTMPTLPSALHAQDAHAVAAARDTSPERLRRSLRGDLDAIALKAMRPEPMLRYRTASELADDLRAHLEDRPVSARRGRRSYAIRRSLRRHRPAAIASMLVLTALGFAAWFASNRRSPAQRFYDEGVRAFFREDLAGASLMLRSALAEDSAFAMAAYYASRVEAALGRPWIPLLGQAVRASRNAPERDRLFIGQAWASLTNNPEATTLARSLAARYPNDAELQLAYGQALMNAGDGNAAIPVIRRVISLDSAGSRNERHACSACEALSVLSAVYLETDSLAAAERTVRTLVEMQPRSAMGWSALAYVLELAGRIPEALEAMSTAAALGGSPLEGVGRARLAIRVADFETADRILRDRIDDVSARVEALWWLVISLRQQERTDEALAMARSLRAHQGHDNMLNATAEAQVLFEMGRFREAAALFDSIAAAASMDMFPPSPDPGLGILARQKSWMLTHAGDALAALRDTLQIAMLADTVERWGSLSAYIRDRRLHHHLRGLLAIARGQNDDAVEEFRQAMHSPSAGFTRANLELGRLLTRLERPREAIPVLQAALRGPLETNGLYATHTELHRALAAAFTTAGLPDSAAVHQQWVDRATRHFPHNSSTLPPGSKRSSR